MTIDNTTSANGSTATITKPQRRLKVKQAYYEYQAKQEHGTQSAISEILLKGKWLNDAGFAADSLVNVQVKHGTLVITVIAN